MSGSPLKMLLFVGMILVLQQLDGNILAPRIIGSSTGISGIWVLFGVMVGAASLESPVLFSASHFCRWCLKSGECLCVVGGSERN